MNRTRPLTLIAIGVAGAVLAFLVQTVLVATGGQRIEPPYTLPFTLAVIGVIMVLLAVPVWRAARRRSERRIDPFHATRIVLLAKASAIAGGLLTGAGVGLVAYLLSRSVAGTGSILMALTTLLGSVVLLAAGLVAEHLCTVPPDDDDEERPGGGTGADGAVV